jgi:hypothetical protein
MTYFEKEIYNVWNMCTDWVAASDMGDEGGHVNHSQQMLWRKS